MSDHAPITPNKLRDISLEHVDRETRQALEYAANQLESQQATIDRLEKERDDYRDEWNCANEKYSLTYTLHLRVKSERDTMAAQLADMTKDREEWKMARNEQAVADMKIIAELKSQLA